MNDKKGAVAIQLNWILVLIIGALILIFFIAIVQKQKSFSEIKIAETVQTDLESIFSSALVSTGTSSIIEIPNKEISFSCEGFKIGNQFPTKYPYAFAPDLIKSERNTLSVYANDWSTPFRVTNFLYVTSPEIKYIIDDSNSTKANQLNELLPPKYIVENDQSKLFMNKEINNPNNVDNTNNYKIRIISFSDLSSQSSPSFGKTKENDITAIYIDSQLDDSGMITFYEKSGTSWNGVGLSNYIGKASLLAAIFSENQEIYECGMKNALERLQLVADIYKKRTDNLGSCDGLYASASTNLNNIKDNADPDNPNYNQIYSEALILEQQNDIILANSCPTIY